MPREPEQESNSNSQPDDKDGAYIDIPLPEGKESSQPINVAKAIAEYSSRLSQIEARMEAISYSIDTTILPYYHQRANILNQLPLINLIVDDNGLEKLSPEHQTALIKYLKPYLTPDEEKKNNHIELLSQYANKSMTDSLVVEQAKLTVLKQKIEELYKDNKDALKAAKELLGHHEQKIKDLEEMIESAKKLISKSDTSETSESINKINAAIAQINLAEKKHDASTEADEKATILFYLIATQNSIDKSEPTRKFLNKIYRDESLSLFLETEQGKQLTGHIKEIENQLIELQYHNLAYQYKREASNIPAQNIYAREVEINKLSSSIQKEIAAEQNHPSSQEKVIEHYIYMMKMAVDNNDIITALIIKDALSVDPKYTLSQADSDRERLLVKSNWIANSAISPQAKSLYLKIETDIPENSFDNIKNIIVGKKPLAQPSLEEKKPTVDKTKTFLTKLAKLNEEIYLTERTFQENMKSFKMALKSIKLTEKSLDIAIIDNIKNEMHYKYTTLANNHTEFESASDNPSLQANIANIKKILEYFNSDEFTQTFKSCEAAINNHGVMEIFIKDLDLKNDEIDPQQLAIFPVQRLPRYILLLTELVKSSQDLAQSYSGKELTETEQKQLQDLDTNLIPGLQKTLDKVKIDVARVNQKSDIIQSNKKIEYMLRKEIKAPRNAAVEKLLAQLKDAKNPPYFNDTYAILKILEKDHKIKTDEYILLASHAESERLLKEQKNLDKKDPNYEKINLNYSIAIHLLKHIDNINPKTRDKVIEFVIKLAERKYETNPQEALIFFNDTKLTIEDRARKHRLHRRHLKVQIADYQIKVSDKLKEELPTQSSSSQPIGKDKEKSKSAEPEEKKELEIKEEKINTAQTTLLPYLKQIELEWKAKNAAIKPKEDPQNHSKHRVKIISEAIEAMEIFATWESDLIPEFNDFLIKNLELISQNKKSNLSGRTIAILNSLKKFPSSHEINYSDIDAKGNTFLPLYNKHRDVLQSKKGEILKRINTNSSMSDEDFKENTLKFLKLTRDQWKIEEYINPSLLKSNRIQRNASINQAINDIEIALNNDAMDKAIKNLQDALIANSPSKNSDVITDITTIQKRGLFIYKLRKVKSLEINTTEKFNEIKIVEKSTATAKQVIPYLEALQEEWKALDDALHYTSDSESKQHNQSRIDLVSDAIKTLEAFKDITPNPYDKIIYELFRKKFTKLINTKKTSPWITRNLEVSRQLLSFSEQTALSSLNDNDSYIEVIQSKITNKKAEIEEQLIKYKDSNNYPLNPLKELVIEYLNTIRDTWKIQELTQNIDADIITARNNKFANIIDRIKADSTHTLILQDLLALRGELLTQPSINKDSISSISNLESMIKKISNRSSVLRTQKETNDFFVDFKPKPKAKEEAKVEAKGAEALTIDKIKIYLHSLQREWEAASTAIENKAFNNATPYSYANRLDLLNQAIVAIHSFETSEPDLANTIYQSFIDKIQTLNIDQDPLRDRTLAVKEQLLKLTPDYYLVVDYNLSFADIANQQLQRQMGNLKTALINENKNPDAVDLESLKTQTINFLKIIDNQWKTQELTINDVTLASSHVRIRRDHLNDAIKALNDLKPDDKNNDQINTILDSLIEKLNTSAPPSRIGFTVRLTAEQNTAYALKQQTQRSLKDIRDLKDTIQPSIESLNTKKAAEEKKQAEEEKAAKIKETEKKDADLVEFKTDFYHGRELSSPEEKEEKEKKEEKKHAPRTPPTEAKSANRGVGSGKIYQDLSNAIKNPLFLKRSSNHEDDKKSESFHKLPLMWEYNGNIGNITDLKPNQAATITKMEVAEAYPALRNGQYQEYKGIYNCILREERKNNFIQISMPKKPDNYDSLDPTVKLECDLDIATTVITLWRDNCGNATDKPFLISDTVDDSLMKALIVVCQKNEIEFLIPSKASAYLSDSSLLADEIKQYESKSREDRAQISRLSINEEELQKIKEDIKTLKEACDTIAATKSSPEEKKQYEDLYQHEIESLKTLFKAVKKQTVTVEELTKALNDSKEHLEATAPRRLRPS